jgi:vacuolar-type H+-ATPase catalytic subunit A/Vma1
MPESEVFKTAMQGGMFGLWLIFIVWMLWYGAPMLRDTMAKMTADNKEAVSVVAKATAEMLSQHEKSCREERQMLQVQFAQERSADRQSRHDMANDFQKALAEVVGSR